MLGRDCVGPRSNQGYVILERRAHMNKQSTTLNMEVTSSTVKV